MFSRKNNSKLARWWWEIDKFSLLIIFVMLLFGAIMVATTSPAVANRIGVEPLYFIRKQLVFLSLAIIILIVFSLQSVKFIEKYSKILFLFMIIALVLVLLKGFETKGAMRWFSVFGFSLQPSEFMKPVFAIFTAMLLSRRDKYPSFPSFSYSFCSYILTVGLIILQPDLGMVIVITAIWCGQLFIAGLKFSWICIISILSMVGVFGAYHLLPHVHKRIDSFLNPLASENYQVERSLDAFASGGLYGKGPGEGIVKQHLPDSHTDFIFAVIGEELGAFICILIMIMYISFVIRSFIRIQMTQNLFTIFAVSGILIQFTIQSFINIGVTLNLMPTKGMTLPFISYGGSSLLAMSMAIGILLSLTRHKYGFHPRMCFKKEI